jgi:hypothetical protein
MIKSPRVYFPSPFSKKAILAYIVILLIILVIFPNKLPLIWITFGITEVVFFFYYLNLLTRKWTIIPEHSFKWRLFQTAFWIRVTYVLFIYFFYQLMTGNPFEFEAGDSVFYHNNGIMIKDIILSGDFSNNFGNGKYAISDSGFPFWLSFLYMLSFNSIIFVRLVNALLGAWMCILLYRLSQRNFGEYAARITAIMAMLLPSLIYYAGLHLKETIMVFLLVAFAERADYMLRSPRFKPLILFQVILIGTALFLFRTVLAVAAWFSLFSAIVFSAKRVIGTGRKVLYTTWFIMAVVVVFSGAILNEVEKYADTSKTNQDQKLSFFSARVGANKLAKYGSTAVFAPVILIAPFPTIVNIETQKNAMLINGSLFTRNVYVFFVIIALLSLYKNKLLTKHVLVIVMLISYLAILSMSGYALSDRFHLPAVPFLIILAGYGVTLLNRRNIKYYTPYLIIIAIIIIFWNWFKLAGRDIL